MIADALSYINDNWGMLFMWGAGGLAVAFFIVWILQGANSKWRWEK